MKLSATEDRPGPCDPFKTQFTKQKSHLLRTGKVTDITHWQKNNKVSDPEHIFGFKPTLCWSETEKNFKCDGKDRP